MKKFISPSTYIAQVKEELKSYFATGAIDDLMFPIWISDALGEYRKSKFPIFETLLEIKNHSAELPCDFESAKTVWACHTISSNPILNPGSFYGQIDCRITPFDDKCHECFDDGECTRLNPDYAVTIKSTGVTWYTYNLSHLLTPATYQTKDRCSSDCDNLHTHCEDTFDIRGNQIFVNFREGKVHMVYYSNDFTDTGDQLVPDDQFTKNYIVNYLKFKVFESLWNTTSDESVNIIERKMAKAQSDMNDARIIAQTEMKKETRQELIERTKREKLRYNKYRRSIR